MPHVSILMPVRNEECYLRAALNSLVRQSYTDWELIAVDDGSTDQTPAILAEAARQDTRIRVIRQEGDGLVMALNNGLQACQGTLLARMDGDDISHPQRLVRQSSWLDTHPETGLVACSFRHFPRCGIKDGMKNYEIWQNGLTSHALIIRDLFVESPFVHPGIMTRRTVLEDLGGYQDHGWPEDYDLWLRMAAAQVQFHRLPEQLIFWRDHPERATRTMDEYATHAFRRCKCHYLRNGFLKSCSEVVIAGAGQEARAWQRVLAEDANISVSTWLDVNPRKRGHLLHGSPILIPEDLELRGRKMLVAIGVHGAREMFRTVAAQRGWQEGVDFVAVA